MGIHDELRNELRAAMRSRDQAKLAVLRAIETEISTAKCAPGFDGEVDDALYQKTVEAYAKKMAKALEQYEAAGERGEAQAEELRFEIDYLQRWLPQKLDEAATRALVKETVEALGVSGPASIGRVMGAVMKDHKKEVDGGLVNRLAQEILSRPKT